MLSSRRMFLKCVVAYAGLSTLSPNTLFAQESCAIQHPLQPPNPDFSDECHNCGMHRSMWARTWYTYSSSNKERHVCSLHCLAEALTNSGNSSDNIKTALYLTPTTMVAADKAVYVIGSRARGTMSMKSKLAFATPGDAEKFIARCGGKRTDFATAYKLAAQHISADNSMINANRLKKGKIIEPVDNIDKCPVCGMYPARYPKNKCQLTLANGKVVHFCATHCLFKYLSDVGSYTKVAIMKNNIWVIDYSSGKWIYAPNAYYIIGSKIMGPMGKEALPFINKNEALSFKASSTGEMVDYEQVNYSRLMGS